MRILINALNHALGRRASQADKDFQKKLTAASKAAAATPVLNCGSNVCNSMPLVAILALTGLL